MKKLFNLTAILAFVLSLGAAVNRIDNFVLPDGNPVLVPGVRQYEKMIGKFELPDNFTVSVPESEKIILELLQKQLSRFGVKVQASQEAVCRFVLDNDIKYGRTSGIRKQSYTLEITDSGIEVRASDGAGLFYGARTLGNLLRNAAKKELACCQIADWPEFDRRGIFFTVEYVRDDFSKLLEIIDLYSDLRINWLLINFSNAFPTELPIFPNKPANSWTPEKVEKLKAFCKARHIEIAVSLQVLTHGKWITKHPDWPKMTEGKPQNFWNSQACALNEEAWKITEKYLQEQIDVFQPKTVFVALDEIYLGPHAVCPKCKAHPDKAELYYSWVRRCEEYIHKQGMEVMFCHDSFVNWPGHKWLIGDAIRAKMDKKDLICFWDYNDKMLLNQMDLFKGFPLAGHAVFGKPLNVYNMSRAVRERGGKDMTIVYWYFSAGLQYKKATENPDSWGGLVNSADYLWGLPKQHYSTFPYDAAYEMARRLTPDEVIPPAKKAYQPLVINRSINAELSKSGKFPALNDQMTAELKHEAAKLPEKFHVVTAPGGRYYGLRLSGTKRAAFNGGRAGIACSIPGNRKIERLAFLITSGRPDNVLDYQSARLNGVKRWKYEPAFRIQLNYADGSNCTKILRFRQDFNHWNRPFGGFGMRWALRGRDVNGAYFSFGIYDFVNPHPEKPVRGFSLGSMFLDGVSPAVLAVSASGYDGKLAAPPQKFNPADIRFPYVDKEDKKNCEARVTCGFEKDMCGYRIDNPFDMKYKIERVMDETKPGEGKTVVKITLAPDKRPGLRLNLLKSLRFEQIPWGLALRCRVTNPDSIARIMNYVIDDKKKEFRSYKHVPEKEWKYFYCELAQPVENEMKDLSVIRESKQSFFFTDLSKGCVIYLDDVGVLDSKRDLAPYWGIDTDAEPL